MADIVTKDVLTLTEVKTLVGQSKQAMVIYDVSTGEPQGLDVEVLIGMDTSIAGLILADSSLNTLTEKVANKSISLETDKTSDTKYTSVKSVYTPMTDAERVTAESLNVLYGKIMTLEAILAAAVYDTSQIDTLNIVKTLNIFGTTNIIIVGTGAPATTPDFIGQVYVKTDATTAVYTAIGVVNSGSWKQTA